MVTCNRREMLSPASNKNAGAALLLLVLKHQAVLQLAGHLALLPAALQLLLTRSQLLSCLLLLRSIRHCSLYVVKQISACESADPSTVLLAVLALDPVGACSELDTQLSSNFLKALL
jgi:hypothetical protein